MAASTKSNDVYIYNIPYQHLKDLCRILDRDNKWEELGGKHMKFDMTTIHELRRCERRDVSPTEQLLSLWGIQNHTVTKLFILLSKMRHYRAMLVLKPLVDSKFHSLIFEGEEIKICQKQAETDSTPEASQNQNESSASRRPLLDKDMNVGSVNLNDSKNEHVPSQNKMVLPVDQPAERKIMNTPENVVSNEQNSSVASNVGATCPPLGEDVTTRRRESKENNCSPSNPQRKISSSSDASSVAESLIIRRIEYSELKQATDNWNKSNILGKGGFGTVFKGNWKKTLVAIKRIEQRGEESSESYQTQMEQSVRELRILNACRHDNILPVYGFSVGGAEQCFVYQYMPNGSLEDRLLRRHGTVPLTWLQRFNIAIGTARGLQFLHTKEKPFIHGDIKSANILLNNNFEPRIGDFGLAREGPQSQYTHMQVSRVHGTLPYLPDEFLRSRLLSTKVDTFSFGIVLFELGTGLRAYDDSRPKKLLKDHVESCLEEHLDTLRDAKAGPCDLEIYTHLMTLGKWCVSQRARDRPEMEEVLIKLENISSFQHLPQYPVQGSSVSPSNPYVAMTPQPIGTPGSVSPEPVSHGNMVPVATNMGVHVPPVFRLQQNAQVNPAFHRPLQQHNAPGLNINHGIKMKIPQEESGNNSVPSSVVTPLYHNLVMNVNGNGVQPHGSKITAIPPPSGYSGYYQLLPSQERPIQLMIPPTEVNGVIWDAAPGVNDRYALKPVIAVFPPSDHQICNESLHNLSISHTVSAKTESISTSGSLSPSKDATADAELISAIPGADVSSVIPLLSELGVKDTPVNEGCVKNTARNKELCI